MGGRIAYVDPFMRPQHNFEIMFGIVFTLIVVVIGVNVVRAVMEWSRNNQSPRLTVNAKVVTKRMQVTHHHNPQGVGGSSSTTYYVTFEVVSGDRMELKLSGSEYGLLVEGDEGMLTFQGTRFLSFERTTR